MRHIDIYNINIDIDKIYNIVCRLVQYFELKLLEERSQLSIIYIHTSKVFVIIANKK